MKLIKSGMQKLEKETFLAVNEAHMAIFWSTPGFKKQQLDKLWVVKEWDLNFCVRNTSLQGITK